MLTRMLHPVGVETLLRAVFRDDYDDDAYRRAAFPAQRKAPGVRGPLRLAHSTDHSTTVAGSPPSSSAASGAESTG